MTSRSAGQKQAGLKNSKEAAEGAERNEKMGKVTWSGLTLEEAILLLNKKEQEVLDSKDKLHRRNMQIKELKKKILVAEDTINRVGAEKDYLARLELAR